MASNDGDNSSRFWVKKEIPVQSFSVPQIPIESLQSLGVKSTRVSFRIGGKSQNGGNYEKDMSVMGRSSSNVSSSR